MARKLRYDYPGILHHVMARGNRMQDIFHSEDDRRLFLDVLSHVNERFGWKIYCYTLMSNHYHILVETPMANLSDGMRQLNGVYTQRYNWLHESCGHLFQGRFKSTIVEKDSYLLELCRYILLNPVRAGMVEHPSHYSWSSYRASVGLEKAPDFLNLSWLIKYIDPDIEIGIARFEEFVQDGLHMNIESDQLHQSVIGTKDFIEMIKKKIEEKGLKIKTFHGNDMKLLRPELDALFSQSDEKKDRNAKIRKGFKEFGYTLSELGRYLGMHPSSISRIVNKFEDTD